MSHTDVLQKIKFYLVRHFCLHWVLPVLMKMTLLVCAVIEFGSVHAPQTHSNVKLQIAATLCVSNLAWHEEEGNWGRSVQWARGLILSWLVQDMYSAFTEEILWEKGVNKCLSCEWFCEHGTLHMHGEQVQWRGKHGYETLALSRSCNSFPRLVIHHWQTSKLVVCSFDTSGQ